MTMVRGGDHCEACGQLVGYGEIHDTGYSPACLRRQLATAREIIRDFHEAWWEWKPNDSTDDLDAAAERALVYLGDVIVLREEPT